jgi:succinate dehydrogenase/fumarate reductase flavoprotein subunit
VVVVGYGGAGAVSAITAYDAGANVVVLEKTPSLASLGITNGTQPSDQISGGGGNTHISGGLCVWPTDPVAGAQHLYALSFGATPMDVCQAWGTMANQNKAWLDSMGIPCTLASLSGEFPNVPGFSSISNYNVNGQGQQLFKFLDSFVQKRNIPVLFNTRATGLIQNPTTGEILGVQASQSVGQNLNIQAKRGVIICTGGFEYDDVMKVRFLKAYPDHFYGWQYNTGDGIKMGQKVGAALWHMNAVSGRPEPWVPRLNQAFSYNNPTNNYIWVNRYGQRFLNESGYPSHSGWCAMNGFNLVVGEYTNLPSFVIFDNTYCQKGPVAAGGPTSTPVQLGGVLGAGSVPGTPWSSNNATEIAAGWIMSGPDIPTLAANIAKWNIIGSNQGMAVPPSWNAAESMDTVTIPDGTSAPNFSAAYLTAAVNQYNSDCAAGKGDTLFQRTALTMAPLQTPPYYALPLWVGGPNTQGGLQRNAKSQVTDPYNNPIPRLYGNGENGSVYGFLYPTGGGDICELIAFGRISGTNAAAEIPWTK